MRPFALVCVLTVFTFGQTRSRADQSPPGVQTRQPPKRVRDALRGDAASAFDRGSILFRTGNFGGARAEFDQAFRLSGEYRVLYNVAVCDKELRRYARAVSVLEESLSRAPEQTTEDYRKKVEETLAILRPFTTTLEIESDQPAAHVLIDDEPQGTTPLQKPLTIDVGQHAVVLRKAGFFEARAVVSAAGGTPAKIKVALEPLVRLGRLSVKAAGLPEHVVGTVVVDGRDTGDAPWTGMISAGLHTVAVRAPGFRPNQQSVDVSPGEQVEALVFVQKDRREGQIRITTQDQHTPIFVDGKLVGYGQVSRRIEVGEHQIRVLRPNEDPYVSEVVVGENETRSINIESRRNFTVPTWVWIAGGVVAVSAGAAAFVLANTSEVRFQGSTPGTLDPRVQTVSFGGF